VLAALASTDAVTTFAEQTRLNLICKIPPYVLVKGGDYATATVVGADDVISWGGRVEIVATVPGYSTSDTITRMKAPAGH
jgi:bifunctional ADP-heptose synthase (sugar kinase/adenylyltransferase)